MAEQNIPPHHLFRPHPNPIHVEERAAQRLRIQALLLENQRLATTQVALEQQLTLSRQEVYHLSSALTFAKQQSNAQVQELYEKAVKIEGEVRVYREYEVELGRMREDVRKMEENKRELEAKLAELEAEVRNVRVKASEVERVEEEIEVMRRELWEGKAALEYEKKMHAVNDEMTQILDENIRSVEQEIPKLMAEVANAKKMERAAAAVATASPGSAYASGYGNSDLGYTANSSGSYAAQQFQGNISGGPQYRSQSTAPAHTPYGTQQNHTQ